MSEKIKKIVNGNEKIHSFKITKKEKKKSTWEFTITDKSFPEYNGKVYKWTDFNPIYTTLKVGDCYFTSYKIILNGKEEYFVDDTKANLRNGEVSYINSLINYYVYSNDISEYKNSPSFKKTKIEMDRMGLCNYLNMCAEFGRYSAVGTGYTRNLRNIIVLDIDVDCTTEANHTLLMELLTKFGRCNALPDFQIFNKESKHIQLQWLIKDIRYKEIDNSFKYDKINTLKSLNNEFSEIHGEFWDFTKITDSGSEYRTFTMALTEIVNVDKFGDKRYTFWKAKNFYAAYLNLYDLELKMPLYDGKEIYYMSRDKMDSLLSTKEARDQYFEEAPTFEELKRKTNSIIKPIVDNIKKKDVDEAKCDDEQHPNCIQPIHRISCDPSLESRNNFVLQCTRNTTFEVMRQSGYNDAHNLLTSDKTEERNTLQKKVKRIVKKKFNEQDKEYNGIWPGTTNTEKYTNNEFESTFNRSFLFALQKFSNNGYTSEQRKRANEIKKSKSDIKVILVDKIKNSNPKMKRNELLNETNKVLSKIGETISLTTLKRYICKLNKLSNDDKNEIYTNFISNSEMKRKKYKDFSINILEYINGKS